jgi:hypothetical protein
MATLADEVNWRFFRSFACNAASKAGPATSSRSSTCPAPPEKRRPAIAAATIKDRYTASASNVRSS